MILFFFSFDVIFVDEFFDIFDVLLLYKEGFVVVWFIYILLIVLLIFFLIIWLFLLIGWFMFGDGWLLVFMFFVFFLDEFLWLVGLSVFIYGVKWIVIEFWNVGDWGFLEMFLLFFVIFCKIMLLLDLLFFVMFILRFFCSIFEIV